MSETIAPPNPNYFTINYAEFYDLIFAMDKVAWEWRNISPGLAFELQQQTSPRFSSLFHLEFEENSRQWRLWRKDAWFLDYEKHRKDKEKSDINNRRWFVRKEALKIMVKSIKQLSGADDEAATVIADNVIRKKSKLLAKSFGVDLESDAFKELLEL